MYIRGPRGHVSKAYVPVYAFGAKREATHRTTYAGAGAYY